MLKSEKATAGEIAYDFPSPKLVSFLKKYFSLKGFPPQSNNFVAFDEFFKAKRDNSGAFVLKNNSHDKNCDVFVDLFSYMSLVGLVYNILVRIIKFYQYF